MTMEEYLKKLKRARVMFAIVSIVLAISVVVATIAVLSSSFMVGTPAFFAFGVIVVGAILMLAAISAADKITQAIFFSERSPAESMPEVEVGGD